jgi:LmbE family N-acetylglucosaminyl deacetylase
MTRACRIRASAIVLLLLVAVCAAAQPFTPGSSDLQLSLERLANTGSVLMIAAHPDDENTALLAYLALGRRLRTGYLSLTRGEGGQNVIGPEQGALLGLIREQELLAARRIDGAEQYFTSAVDFGYTKSAEETLRKWDRDKILGEIVGVIRRFQPDVVILRWTGTPADRHGQHQASGILGMEAIRAAQDPSRYTDQQVAPWTTKRVFFFQNKAGMLAINTGAYDPLLGYSYAQIAGMASSQHRSQAMGAAQVVGPARVYLNPVTPQAAVTDVMTGIETGPSRISPQVAGLLTKAISSFEPKRPHETIPTLLEARRLLRSLSGDLVARKLRELDDLILRCAGMWIDAGAESPYGIAQSVVPVHAKIINRSPVPIRLEAVDLEGAAPTRAAELPENTLVQQVIRWTVRQPVPLAQFRFRIGGEPVLATRPVVYRYVDKVLGERTQPFAVVPPVSVAFTDRTILFRDTAPKSIAVRLKSYSGAVDGKLSLGLPSGWLAQPPIQPFHLERDQPETTVHFEVTPASPAATMDVRAIATLAGPTVDSVDSSVAEIRYPHIPTQFAVQPSNVPFTRADVRILATSAGYVEGAGDEVAAAIRQLGCQVNFLAADDLASGDLEIYDVIVIGVRAFNLRQDLRANIGRLNEYVRKGGALIVQYNTATDLPPTLGPYPIRIGSDRVSVEEAPVQILVPRSPVLNFPNKITLQDFENWVQERGLYFPSQWDQRYEAPIASNDPGEQPLRGGILFAKYGEGAYVYTSYSWFRQLPAGVPGAYRLFANLLSQ